MAYPTGRRRYGEGLGEGLVVVCHYVNIPVVTWVYVLAVDAEVFHLGYVLCGGVAVGVALELGAVDVETCLYHKAVDNLVAYGGGAVDTLFGLLAAVHVGEPVRVIVAGHRVGPDLLGTFEHCTANYRLSWIVEISDVVWLPLSVPVDIVVAVVVHVNVAGHTV